MHWKDRFIRIWDIIARCLHDQTETKYNKIFIFLETPSAGPPLADILDVQSTQNFVTNIETSNGLASWPASIINN